MQNLRNLDLKKISFLVICLFPLTIIIGQVAISINYMLVTICFFLLLKIKEFRLLLKENILYTIPFFFILIITQMINLNNYEVNEINKSVFYFKNFFLFFVIFYSLKENLHKKIFLYVIFFCCLFVAIDNFFQYFVGYDIFGIKKATTRLTGPFGDNEYVSGSYIAKFSIFFLPLLFFKKKLNFLIPNFLIILFFFQY